MTVVGVTMVRDEADIIEHTLRHMATQVDYIMVANNGSVDGTEDIILRLISEGLLIAVTNDHEVGYEQSRKMTGLAHLANDWINGADWIVPFDADEIWCHDVKSVRDLLMEQAPGVDVVLANLFDHVSTGWDDPTRDPVSRSPWRREHPAPLPKVACRYHESMIIEMGNHGATYPYGLPTPSPDRLMIHHFPYRSPEQVVRKITNGAQAYAATDLPEHFGSHWRQWGRILEAEGPEAIEALYHKWHWRADPEAFHDIDGERQGPLILDPAPVSPSTV